jgi:hypothetical protein
MHRITRAVSSFSLAIAGFLTTAQAYAVEVNPCPRGSEFSGLCLDASSFGQTLGTIITFAFVLAGIISLIFLVWGGLRWVFSQGETKQVEGARNQIIAALVGLIFVFLSYLLVNLMLQLFAGTNLQSLEIPTIGR